MDEKIKCSKCKGIFTADVEVKSIINTGKCITCVAIERPY